MAGIRPALPGLRLRCVGQVIQAVSEERKVAAKDNMRCESDHRRGLLLFEKIADEAFKRNLSLSERTLIERCENFAGLDQRDQLLEQIGCDDLNLSKQAFLFKRLENRNAVCCADIQALRLRFTAEQRNCLAIRFPGTFMRLDRRKQAEMRSKHGK